MIVKYSFQYMFRVYFKSWCISLVEDQLTNTAAALCDSVSLAAKGSTGKWVNCAYERGFKTESELLLFSGIALFRQRLSNRRNSVFLRMGIEAKFEKRTLGISSPGRFLAAQISHFRVVVNL